MFWALVQQIGRQVSSYSIFLILASLLDPRHFGLLGMATAWIALIRVFSEVGFSAALIQRQEIEPKHLSTTFYINIGLGTLLTVIGMGLSWPAATFFKTPEVQPVMAVLSAGFVINAFSLTQMAIAQRELRFRDLAVRDISASVVGGIVGIVFAYSGFGVWSLVIQSLVNSTVGSLLIWILSDWRPRLSEISLKCINELWDYSSKIFSFNIFKYFAQNIDKLVIGYLLGPAVLGLYSFAYRIVLLPVASIVEAIGGYLFPQFSRMQQDSSSVKLRYLFIIKVINGIVMPTMVVVGLSSPMLVPVVFGQKWVSTIPLIQIFTVIAVMQSFISPVGQLMKALNRPGWLFNWSVVFALITTLCTWLGSHWDIVGVGAGLAVAHIIALPVIYSITARLIPVNIRLMLNELFPAVASSLVLGVSLGLALRLGISSHNVKVAVGIIVGMVSYGLTLIWLDKAFIFDIFKRFAKYEISAGR